MSPRTATQNREIRAATRAKLLNAALELFASRGYAATSVDAIAEAAGMSVGLLYYHFDSKTKLLDAIFEQSLADVQATFSAADREPDPAGRLPALLRSAAAIVRTLERYLEDIGWPGPAIEARLLFAQIDGLCQHYVLDPKRYPLEQVIERLIDRYAKGAGDARHPA
jgi:AcrR family transcriptional regulator